LMQGPQEKKGGKRPQPNGPSYCKGKKTGNAGGVIRERGGERIRTGPRCAGPKRPDTLNAAWRTTMGAKPPLDKHRQEAGIRIEKTTKNQDDKCHPLCMLNKKVWGCEEAGTRRKSGRGGTKTLFKVESKEKGGRVFETLTSKTGKVRAQVSAHHTRQRGEKLRSANYRNMAWTKQTLKEKAGCELRGTPDAKKGKIRRHMHSVKQSTREGFKTMNRSV